MKNLLIVFLLTLTVGNKVIAKPEDEVGVKIEKVTRVEKYGWDNLEVIYRLTNKSDRNLERVDFTVALIDNKNREIGSIDVHDFHIKKRSKLKHRYIEMTPDFVNEVIDKVRLLPESVLVRYKEPVESQMVMGF